jgi:DNA-binding Xre family transcriptional regulator
MIAEKYPPVMLCQINKYVKGDLCNYTMPTIMRICSVLEVTPNDIIDYESRI